MEVIIEILKAQEAAKEEGKDAKTVRIRRRQFQLGRRRDRHFRRGPFEAASHTAGECIPGEFCRADRSACTGRLQDAGCVLRHVLCRTQPDTQRHRP